MTLNVNSKQLKINFQFNLILFLLSVFQSGAGQAISGVALIYLVNALTHSTSAMALTLLFKYSPYFILPFFSGFIDRFSGKIILIINNIVAGLFLVLVFFLYSYHYVSASIIYLCAFVTGSMAAIYAPITQKILPTLVDENRMFLVNVRINQTYQVITIASLIFAGVLINRFGPALTILIEGCFYLIAAVMMGLVRVRKIIVNKFISSNGIKIAVTYILTNKSILLAISIQMLFSFLIAPFQVILPAHLLSLHLGANYYTLALSGFIVGMLLGNQLYRSYYYKVNINKLWRWSIVFSGVIFLLLSLLLDYIVTTLLVAFIGIILALINNSVLNLLQKEIAYEFKGRVFSLIFSLMQGVTALSLALTSILVKFLGYGQIILFFLALFGLLSYFYLSIFKNLNSMH